jgi:hypothetical protein
MNLFYQNRPASRQLSGELAPARYFFPRTRNLVAFKSSGAKHIERRIRLFIFALHGFGAFDLYAIATEQQCQLLPGGLNRSTQHFILEGKDGVRNGTKIS